MSVSGILIAQQNTTTPVLSQKESPTQIALSCAFSSEVRGSSALKTTSYYIPSTSQSTENMSTDFTLPEDISPIPILGNKR